MVGYQESSPMNGHSAYIIQLTIKINRMGILLLKTCLTEHLLFYGASISWCHCFRRIERMWISQWWQHVISQIKIQTQITRISLQSKIVEMLCHQSRSRLLATVIQQNSCRGPRVPWGAIIIGALQHFLKRWLKWQLKLAGQASWF